MKGLDFSFAGLKTALLYKVRDLGPEETERRKADLAASYEHAIVEALIARTERALANSSRGWRSAAASPRTASCASARRRSACAVHVPPHALCTDNAAMIASAARFVDAGSRTRTTWRSTRTRRAARPDCGAHPARGRAWLAAARRLARVRRSPPAASPRSRSCAVVLVVALLSAAPGRSRT